MEPTPGMLINPRIRLLEELGRGSMGSVWRAEHLTLETRVAVKLIAQDAAQGIDEALERFHREARAAARIKSHHVVQTLDHGVTEEGEPYIVLELLEGQSLDAELAQRGPLSLADTSRIVTHVCRALASGHEVGIIHRDIKPGNIFCTEVEGSAFYKVLDFGVAKLEREQRLSDVGDLAPSGQHTDARQLTVTGALIGTPDYMSPDLMMAEPVTPSDDLWALAVVAYECLTGVLPFHGEDFDALSLSVINAEYEPPSTLAVGLSPSVDAWFARALSPRPADRFESADQVSASFAALCEAPADPSTEVAPGRAEDDTLTSFSASARSRNRAIWLAGGLLGVLFATLLISRSWSARPESPSVSPGAVSTTTPSSSTSTPSPPGPESPTARPDAQRVVPSEPLTSARVHDLGKRFAPSPPVSSSSGAPRSAAPASPGASSPPELPERALGF